MHRESSPQPDPSTDPSSSSTTAPPATNRHHARRRPASWTLAALGGLVALGLVFVWLGSREQTLTLKYGEFKKRLVAGEVARVTVGRQELIGTLKPIGDGNPIPFRAAMLGAESSDRLENLLETYLPDGSYEGQEGPSAILEFLVPTLSIVILIAAIFYLQSRAGGVGSAMAFVRSRHKVYDKPDRRITFADVAGNEEAVAELSEVVEFLKTPGKFQALGGRLPKGVLLVGPPGTGKTLLAKAVAGEAGVPFFSLSGSDFVEMFVGVGAARVRSLFAQAEAKAPCLIFIDELDAIGKARGSGGTGNHDERDQTLNQLLVAMDGFDSNLGVIVMAATNRPETLDAALVRPGRFDRNVVVDRPDLSGREQILKVHTRSMALDDELNLRHIAAMTSGFVGADLANLVNEAALLAARKNKDRVGRMEFEEGVERVIAGPEKRQRVLREDEKERIAYHEAGHAIVSRCLPGTDPVHKVSILGRGNGTLGYTMYRPEDDRFLHTRSWLLNCIASLLGGTLAEEIVYGEWSDGATSDLQRATQIARKMVAEFGMSTRLGRVSYQGEGRSPFMAGGGANSDGWSEQTAREIDEEVRKILAEAQAVATGVLTEKRGVLEEVTRLLMDQETIDASELQAILDRP